MKKIYIIYVGIDVKGILLITAQDNIFLTFERYVSHVQNILTLDARVVVISIEKCRDFKEFWDEEYRHSLRVGIEENSITIREYEQYIELFGVKLAKTNDIIEKMRSVKDEEEIEAISTVAKKLDNCLKNIESELIPGIKEKTLEKKLLEKIRSEALDIVDIRISFGENTSKPYLKATNHRLEEIDVVIIDITAKEYGKEYMATIARNFFVGDVEKKWPTILEEYTKLYYLEDKMILRT